MKLTPLKLEGAYQINLNRLKDERGYFMRFFDRNVFAEHDLPTIWEQESLSYNRDKNTLRGLHFQNPPVVEAKIVRVVSGAILDVLVDLRKNSKTYGEWEMIELSEENETAVFIPKGFAHGFCTIADNTYIEYKIDVPYQPNLADGIRWNDNYLSIKWEIENPIISERDSGLQFFADFDSPFL